MATLRNIIVALVLIIAVSKVNAAEKILLVSDLDDTVKVTQTNKPVRMIINGFFTKKVFAGMPELYQYMQAYTDKTVILTSSPNLLRKKINKLLDKFAVPRDQLITRSLKRDKDSYKYKFNNIVKQIQEEQPDKVILVGDDSGEDHHIYADIRAKYPEKVAAIYIRPVKNVKLPEGIMKYITTYDIALNEYKEGRLNLVELRDIAYIIRNTEDKKTLIPKSSMCPKRGVIDEENGRGEEGLEVRIKLIQLCACR